MAVHLFFNFSYDADFQLFLPHAFVAEQRNGCWYLLRKATEEVLKNSPIELSVVEKEALVLSHSLDPLPLLEKYTDRKDQEEVYSATDREQGQCPTHPDCPA